MTFLPSIQTKAKNVFGGKRDPVLSFSSIQVESEPKSILHAKTVSNGAGEDDKYIPGTREQTCYSNGSTQICAHYLADLSLFI